MLNRSELMPMLVCPACRADLQSLDACSVCGRTYAADGDIPSLVPTDVEREVRVPFHSSRSVMGEAFRRSFQVPPIRGKAASGAPYHLDRSHQAVLESLDPGAFVLEIGCGGGQMRSYIQGQGLRYLGVDISAVRVFEELRRHGGPDLLCDSHFLPFKDGTFDLVYSAAVTEHLACPQLVAQEVARVLKPGGHYLGNVSFLEPWHDDSFFHMSPLGVFEFLTQAGFEIDHIWPGEGYSGFKAIMAMGNRVTGRLAWLGEGIYRLYRSSNALRTRLRPREGTSEIAEAATVAGAIDWIARKPRP